MAKPRYDDEFRASAILMLDAAGWPNVKGALTRVSRHLGINHQTLTRWAHGQQNPPPPRLVQGLKTDVVELLDDIIFGVAAEAKRRIDQNELDDVSLPQLMTAMGICVDKKQLLTGKPTAINEDRVSDARSQLAQQLDRIAAVSEATEATQYTN